MPDLNAPWGTDLSLSPTGGLELVSGLALTQQRLTRRLMTVPGTYIFEPTYGAGLPSYVGSPMNAAAITALVAAQATQEPTVASVTSVTINAVTVNGFMLTVIFVAAATGTSQTLTFSVTPTAVAAA